MKKLSLGIVTFMLVLAIMLPVSVNAATLSTGTSKMNVGDIVEIEVTAEQEVESIQFDLKFDRSKYDYVVDSATTEGKLEATDSNYIANDIVRVSAFDLNGGKAKTVKMKFKATAAGESVPFNIVGLVEIGENGEDFNDKGTVTVKQIVGGVEVANSAQYVDSKGEMITTLPKTGSQDAIRIYGALVAGKNVVAYALPDSQDTVTSTSLKEQFGNQITVKEGILGTGDTFVLNNETYTILIYGDVNGDGKVTTLDALTTIKAEKGTQSLGANSDVKEEALDVVKDSNKDNDETANALAEQAFILKKQYNTQENTIIDVYPTEAGNTVNGIDSAPGTTGKTYRYEDISLAMVSAKNGETITENMLTYKVKLEGTQVGNDVAEVTYEAVGQTGNFDLKFYATRTGKYEVIPMVVGVTVEGGVVEGEAIPITITENTSVTDIEITDKNGNIIPKTEAITMKANNKANEFGINFLHSYYKKDGSLAETAKVSTDKASITKTGSITNAAFDGQTATKMLLTAMQQGTGTVTVTVNNSEFGEADEVRTINVNIVGPAATAGITLNGTKLSDTKTAVDNSINLYKGNSQNPVGNNETKIIPVDGRDLLFTIVPIQLRDIDGDEFDIKVSDVVQDKGTDDYTGKVVVYETADTEFLSTQDIVMTYFKNENGNYVQKEDPSDSIDAIGIALATDLDDGWEAYMKDGLTFEYDTTAGRKAATIAFGGIYENGNNLLSLARETVEPQSDDIEVEEEQQQEEVVVAPQKVKAVKTLEEEKKADETKAEETKTPEVEVKVDEEVKDEDKEITTPKEEEKTKEPVIPEEPEQIEQPSETEEVVVE